MSPEPDLSRDPSFAGPEFDRLLEHLAEASPVLERPGAWPADQFVRLAASGVLGWVIPRDYGGSEVAQEELIYGYERLATACLTTTFVLTQRNGACQRIAGAEQPHIKHKLLPPLAAGELFATVGVSHLTTSRQHWKQPAVRAARVPGGIRLEGSVPWVTGARQADYVVTGGTCDDGRQVLIALPTRLAGVRVGDPAPLLALNASQTASIELDGTMVPEEFVLAGPVENVMGRGEGGGTGSVATSSLAVGLSARAVEHLDREADARPDLRAIVQPLHAELAGLRRNLYAAARGESAENNPRLSAASIRQRSNSLVLRATQAHLAASKGAGFVVGHPAERAVREAMFFLVWSCPQPVLTAALREFACLE
jgi:alkylation response protein AidB-like acyl-CoA dehydrogenase